jgi:leucine efflux protein
MMDGLVHLPAFLAAAATVIVVPGPATLLVAARAGVSRRGAAVATAGIVAGDVLAITLAGAGLAGIAAQMPGLIRALRLLGSAWIAWLGVTLLRAPRATPGLAPAAVPPSRRAFAQALAMTLTNPKPMLFFAAFFPLFIAPGVGPSLAAFWRLGALFEALNLAWFAAVIALAGAFARRQGPAGRSLQRLAGAALLGCAALMLVAS